MENTILILWLPAMLTIYGRWKKIPCFGLDLKARMFPCTCINIGQQLLTLLLVILTSEEAPKGKLCWPEETLKYWSKPWENGVGEDSRFLLLCSQIKCRHNYVWMFPITNLLCVVSWLRLDTWEKWIDKCHLWSMETQLGTIFSNSKTSRALGLKWRLFIIFCKIVIPQNCVMAMSQMRMLPNVKWSWRWQIRTLSYCLDPNCKLEMFSILQQPCSLLFLPITSNNPSFQFPNGLLTSRPTPDTHKKWSLTSIPNGDCYLSACSPLWMVAW